MMLPYNSTPDYNFPHTARVGDGFSLGVSESFGGISKEMYNLFADQSEEEIKRQRLHEDAVSAMVSNSDAEGSYILGSLVGSLADPVGLITGTKVAEGALSGGKYLAKALGYVNHGRSTFLRRTGKGVLEGAAFGVPIEATDIAHDTQLGLEFSPLSVAHNFFNFGLLGGAFAHVNHAFHYYKTSRQVKAHQAALDLAAKQIANDEHVNIVDMMDSVLNERNRPNYSIESDLLAMRDYIDSVKASEKHHERLSTKFSEHIDHNGLFKLGNSNPQLLEKLSSLSEEDAEKYIGERLSKLSQAKVTQREQLDEPLMVFPDYIKEKGKSDPQALKEVFNQYQPIKTYTQNEVREKLRNQHGKVATDFSEDEIQTELDAIRAEFKGNKDEEFQEVFREIDMHTNRDNVNDNAYKSYIECRLGGG